MFTARPQSTDLISSRTFDYEQVIQFSGVTGVGVLFSPTHDRVFGPNAIDDDELVYVLCWTFQALEGNAHRKSGAPRFRQKIHCVWL